MMDGKSWKDLKIEDIFALNERIFSFAGVWPIKSSSLKFFLLAIYLIIYVATGVADLIDVLDNLDLLVANLLETLIGITTTCIIFMIRFNAHLPQTIEAVRADIANLKFTSSEETHMYLAYNHGAGLFGRVIFFGAASVSVLYFIGPALQLLIEGKRDSSEPYILPYRVKAFFDYSELKWYICLYLFRMPVTLVGVLHSGITSLLVNLVFHLCGKVTILAHRIRTIPVTTKQQFDDAIAHLVPMHVTLVQLCVSINDSFHWILLMLLCEGCCRLGLCIYAVSSRYAEYNVDITIRLVMYVIMMYLLLFSYCYIGEQLVQECKNVQDAYYFCNWQMLPKSSRKSLMICMTYGQKYLTVTAGKVYTYSLYGFSGILKTTMGFVSMLQAFS